MSLALNWADAESKASTTLSASGVAARNCGKLIQRIAMKRCPRCRMGER
jgi:hypothetical protein